MKKPRGYNKMDISEKQIGIGVKDQITEKFCPLSEYCRCNFIHLSHCCIWRRYAKLNFDLCHECPNNIDCLNPTLISSEIYQLKLGLTVINHKQHPIEFAFDTYMPKIDMGSEKKFKSQIRNISHEQISSITVSLNEILSEKKNGECYLRPKYRKPLHELIPWSGRIILTTNIKDKYCKFFLENPEIFISIIKLLKPDVLITADANFYTDLPEIIIQLQSLRIKKLNTLLFDLGIPLVGLVPPNIHIFNDMVHWFLERNITILAIPMLEMNRKKKLSKFEVEFSLESAEITIRQSISNDDKATRKFIKEKIIELWFKYGIKFLILSGSPNSDITGHYYSSKSWLFVKNKGKELKELYQGRKLGRLIKAAKMKNVIFENFKRLNEFER
jgi:hypothetical protein